MKNNFSEENFFAKEYLQFHKIMVKIIFKLIKPAGHYRLL